MRTPRSLLLTITCFLGLSACSNTPDGFVASPTVTAYFQGLVPSAATDAIELISVCPMGGRYDERWSTTVLFEDGDLYHYELTPTVGSVELKNHSTRSQRNDKARNFEDGPGNCLGTWKAFEGYTGGSYRFAVGKHSMHGAVYERIVVNYPFDDEVKQRLKGAAAAVEAAIVEHRKFTPVEQSWGVQP